MKNLGKLFIVLIMILVIILICLLVIFNKKDSNDTNNIQESSSKIDSLNNANAEISQNNLNNAEQADNDNNTNQLNNKNDNKLKEFTFSTAYGNGTFKIKAENALCLFGFVGASSNIYYLIDGNLYYHTDKDVLLANGIKSIYKADEGIVAVVAGDYDKFTPNEENNYIKYVSKEEESNYIN